MFSLCRSLLKLHEIHMKSIGVLPLGFAVLLGRALCWRRCRTSARQDPATAWAVPVRWQVSPVPGAGVEPAPQSAWARPGSSTKARLGHDLGYILPITICGLLSQTVPFFPCIRHLPPCQEIQSRQTECSSSSITKSTHKCTDFWRSSLLALVPSWSGHQHNLAIPLQA